MAAIIHAAGRIRISVERCKGFTDECQNEALLGYFWQKHPRLQRSVASARLKLASSRHRRRCLAISSPMSAIGRPLDLQPASLVAVPAAAPENHDLIAMGKMLEVLGGKVEAGQVLPN